LTDFGEVLRKNHAVNDAALGGRRRRCFCEKCNFCIKINILKPPLSPMTIATKIADGKRRERRGKAAATLPHQAVVPQLVNSRTESVGVRSPL
jgi:hypothetical protein